MLQNLAYFLNKILLYMYVCTSFFFILHFMLLDTKSKYLSYFKNMANFEEFL